MEVSTTTQQKFFTKLLARPDNSKCADCNSKAPSWASIDFGVLVCLNCSGSHRALGPSITRVKSTKLDTWMSDWMELITIGNQNCNKYWQANIGSFKKPNTSSSLEQITKFVKDKYIKKRFAIPGEKDPVTYLKERKSGATTKPQPKQTKPPAPTKQQPTKSGDSENASVQSEPGDILQFQDFEPPCKPALASNQLHPQPELLSFGEDAPTQPSIKRSHSLEPLATHPLYNPQPQPQHQHTNLAYPYHHQNSMHYHHHPQIYHPHLHQNAHMAQMMAAHHNPYMQQQSGMYNYGMSNLTMPQITPTQPQYPMGMSINMYAQNISFNINSEPPKTTKQTSAPPTKKDGEPFGDFDQFKF